MTATRPAPRGAGRGGLLVRPSRWSLRTRLLAALVVLLAAVCLIVGTATEVALRHFLLGKLDEQLIAAGNRSAGAVGAPPDTFSGHGGARPIPPGDGGAGTGFLLAPGQSPGTLGARIADGEVTATVLTESGTGADVAGADATALLSLPVDRRPHTLTVGDERYRLLAARTPDGDVFITGLPLSPVYATLHRLIAIEVAVAGAGLVTTGLAGAVIVRRTLRPLRRVAATATRVSELPLHRGEVSLAERVPEADTDARTEVGQVGAALNRLLGHVSSALAARHASETRVRQFVADASHELRTPLAVIRGYAELTRRSRADAPPELAHAMQRVEAEAARMTTLVEDLLLLARLDSGRPVAAEPVDLTRVVLDAVSDASAAGPLHRWRLDLPEQPVTVTGDAAGLHQVLANLLANARAHTPAGTTVTTSLSVEPSGGVALRVVDDGPGIAPDLLPQVFERFARGDSSRSRAAGSTGLGLSIVAAVVGAHGGTVDVASRPGRTAFTVSLRPAPPDAAADGVAPAADTADAADAPDGSEPAADAATRPVPSSSRPS